jgi:outer membrane autotransporter protein
VALISAAGALCLATSGKALASAGCDAVNAGGWNQTLAPAPGSFGTTISDFEAGDELQFSVTTSAGVSFFRLDSVPGTDVLGFGAPGSGTYTVTPPHTAFRTVNQGFVNSITITATCTPAPPPDPDPTPSPDQSEAVTKGFLVSRINGILLNDPGSTSLLNRGTGQGGATTTASLGNMTSIAGTGNGFGNALALGASRFDDADDAAMGSQTIQFSGSLSRMRRDAASARMALGAGDGGSLPLGYETYSPWDIWVEGRYSAFDDDAGNLNRDGHVGVLYVGGDYRVASDMIVGALVQFDWSKDDSSALASKVDGNGWMAGPYLSARVHENIYLDLRAAWGRSSNDMTLGATTGGFDTTRWLVKGRLAGNWAYDALRLTPSAELAYVEESADAFTNSAGTFVPGQDVSLGRLQFGPEFGYRFAHTADTFVEPFAAIRGVWDFDNPNVAIIDGFVVGPGDFWGRLEGGLNVVTSGGTYVRGSASWDGVGASNYSGYTLQGTVNVPLN